MLRSVEWEGTIKREHFEWVALILFFAQPTGSWYLGAVRRRGLMTG